MIETFPMIPRHSGSISVVAPILLLVVCSLVGAAGALAYTFSASKTARFEVSQEGLRLRGDFYGRLIPVAQLQVAEAKPVDLTVESPLRRTEKHVVYVPTSAGYSVLLSVADPGAFVAALRGLSK